MPSSAASDRRRRADHTSPEAAAGEPRSGRRDTGQAAVELALCLPLVMLLLLGVVQVAMVVRGELLVQHAAREGARAASVSATPAPSAARAVEAALGTAGMDADGASTAVAGGQVRVTVRATTRTDVPLVGALVGDVSHRAAVAMVLEPP